MKHLLIIGSAPDPDQNKTNVFNSTDTRAHALALGKEMALYHDEEIHVYELVKILKPVTTVELNDPPADARPPRPRVAELNSEITDHLAEDAAEEKKELNKFNIVGKGVMYKWKGQPEILNYLGKEGQWHRFALRGTTAAWCEVLDKDLRLLEFYTFPPAPHGGKIPEEVVPNPADSFDRDDREDEYRAM